MSEVKLRNALQPGHKLHWYRIERVLGQGGFGITYLAYDTNLEQHVAIKEYLPLELAVRDGDSSVYPASQAQDERYRWGLDRFLAEARTLARFKHPAIVRVLSVFEANNTAYMVMEYQHGQSLQQILERRRTLSEAELLRMLEPLLDGLAVIHAQGFIHRDIKPPNLFVRHDGATVLLDFGSARQALGVQTQTLTSVVSPGYAPFEQYYSKSDRQGPWTDIYGLGATLYRCVSGRQPMAAIDRSEAILKAERDVFVSALEVGEGRYSSAFLEAIDAALEFNAGRRPQTIAEWRQRFEFPEHGEFIADDATTKVDTDDAPTRFSAVADDSFDVTTGAIFNSDARPVADAGRSAPARTAPARTVAGTLRPMPRPRRRGVIALIVGAVAVVATAWTLGRAGLLPDLTLTSREGREVQRLIAQGDRALAAGEVYEPTAESALAFYVRAYQLAPDDAGAAHGLRIAAERLAAAVRTAIADGDAARAATLAALFVPVPPAVYDATPVQAELLVARAEGAERDRQAARIAEILAQAQRESEAGRLMDSGTDNALAKYRAVQILDPDNADAAAGIDALAAKLAASAEAALTGGDLEAATRAADIDELLRDAAADVGAERLSSPAGRNALERYRRVLALDPGNALAERGIEQIHDRYLAQASAALKRDAIDEAVTAIAKARTVLPASPRATVLDQEVVLARQRLENEAAAQRAAEAAAEVEAMARVRAEAERRQIEDEAERRRRQDAEASRLYAEAKRKAAEEQALQDAQQAAIAAVPEVVLDFHGFDAKYRGQFVTPERVIAAVAPLLNAAGYHVFSRGEVQGGDFSGHNLKLIVYRLNVNENTATGLYSYAGSVNVFGADALPYTVPQVLASSALWTQAHNGLGPPSDLHWMIDHYARMTQAFIEQQPGRR